MRPVHFETLEQRLLLSGNPPAVYDIALIDRSLPDASTLIGAALGNTRVITYDGLHQSSEQVLDLLNQTVQRDGWKIHSLSIFSHGSPGRFLLGDQWVNVDDVDQTSAGWETLRSAMTSDATVQIYGCDTADGISGRKLLDRISQYTGAAVFGSTNITGRGGDWKLEAVSDGSLFTSVKAPLNASALADYQGQLDLGIFTNNADVGGPTLAGSSSYNSGTNTYSLTGSGVIASTYIQCQYCYTTITGDGTLTARVASLTLNPTGTPSSAAKAGILFADSPLAGGSAMVATYVSGKSSQGLRLKYRLTDGAADNTSTSVAVAAPYWLRLVRLGDTFAGYYSADGISWTQLTSQTVTLNAPVSVGLFIESHSNSQLDLANFDHVTWSPYAPPTVATAASATPSTVSATTSALSVLGSSSGGESVLSYTWAATSEPSGANPIFSDNGDNTAKNCTVTFNKAGSYTLTATISDGTNYTTSSVSVTVNQTLTSVAVTPASPTIQAGTTQQLVATACDQFGAAMASQPTFTWSLDSGGGGVDSSGLYTAPTSPTVATVTATTGSLSGSDQVTVTPASASQLVYAQQPTNTTAGSTISPAVTVDVEDQYGNLVTTDTSSVTLSVHSGSGSLNGTLTEAASGGIATFSNLSINTADNYTLTAADGSLTSATSNSFTISPAAATQLIYVQQPTNAIAGVAISPAIVLDLEDQYGNIATNDNSNVTLSVHSGPGSLSSTATVAASSGVVTFSNAILDTVGSYTLTASDGSVTSTASNSITISPAAAAKVVCAQQPTSTTAGSTISPAVTVDVEDQYGNLVTTDGSNVTLSVHSGPGALNGTLTEAASGGIATFADLSINTAGSYTLTAADGSLTSATSNSFTISPATAAKVV
ncbi:MAG: DUF4347 domain-containing protein, partial [Tepidisphaeraceae bacterium]